MLKGPLTAINLQLMVTKFEEIGSLNVRSGRGRKPVSAEAIEKVALQVEEDKASNVQASSSIPFVAEALDLSRLTVRKIMRNILRYYLYKLQLCRNCFHMISRLDICSHCSFLLVWKLIQNGLGIPSDRRSTLSFLWFSEYSQLSNLGIRQSAFHLTSPATLTNSNGVVWVSRVFLFLARIFSRN
ncbi:uncharacterized protein TNCV_3135801 [Trichonephila clavipes]|nr:uncharacterized protein TNCV_3135801 [Trichonephila clavipes]